MRHGTPDADLVNRSELRESAFTEFAAAITPRLFRAALLMCADWHLAEDLVQTTLAKLYVGWARVERADSPEGYARGTLTKTFLSHKRVRRNSETPSLEKWEWADATPDPSVRLELFAALRTLSPLDRAIVVLRYWEDRSVTETARGVGLSEGAVRTRASRALARLQAELSEKSTGTRTGMS